MTQEVLKSVADQFGDFEAQVQSYCDELNSHDKHMILVADHARSEVPISPEEKAHPYPAPQAHPLIVPCVRKTKLGYIPDYVLVDRLRVTSGTLQQRKNELINEVATAENQALLALLPAGKWRHYNNRHKDILDADAARHTDMQNSRKDGDPAVTKEEVIAARHPDDHAFVTEHEARHEQGQAIYKHASQMMHDIEDLTEDNLHEWQMKPFPEAK